MYGPASALLSHGAAGVQCAFEPPTTSFGLRRGHYVMLSVCTVQADPNNGQYTIQKWAAAADVKRIRMQFTEIGAIDWAGTCLPMYYCRLAFPPACNTCRPHHPSRARAAFGATSTG